MAGFIQIYTEKERNNKIKRELKKLKAIFSDIGEKNRGTVERLIENAAFLAVTLEETQKIINRDGVIEEYQNGENQRGMKKSSAVEVYDKSMNTYSKVIKQLCDLLPKEADMDPAKEIMQFIKGGSG